jgi:hypothetical protein
MVVVVTASLLALSVVSYATEATPAGADAPAAVEETAQDAAAPAPLGTMAMGAATAGGTTIGLSAAGCLLGGALSFVGCALGLSAATGLGSTPLLVAQLILWLGPIAAGVGALAGPVVGAYLADLVTGLSSSWWTVALAAYAPGLGVPLVAIAIAAAIALVPIPLPAVVKNGAFNWIGVPALLAMPALLALGTAAGWWLTVENEPAPVTTSESRLHEVPLRASVDSSAMPW